MIMIPPATTSHLLDGFGNFIWLPPLVSWTKVAIGYRKSGHIARKKRFFGVLCAGHKASYE
jgi:hypothetical protein